MKKNKQILLTWDAYNNGFVVTAQTVSLLSEKYDIEIDEIFYLQNQTLQASNLAEIDLFYKKIRYSEALKKFPDDDKLKSRLKKCNEIRDRLGDKIPKFKNKNINIKGVTDYQSIYDKLVYLIKKELLEKDNLDLHINVSPGTPQMHVVWLMLNSAGFLPSNTTLWSSQWVKDSQKTVLNKVNFKPKTYLSQILESKYFKNHLPEIIPDETKSLKRKKAEDRLEIFAHIPNAPMLLLGERGTGKSTYARTLIKNYQDKNLPFEELTCGTFSEELMRSELFGHEKGAFTGATEKKSGFLSKFKNGGILFLDEIHDLSRPLQRKLMQVLQTGVYYPIGATKPEKSIFRLVSASNLSFSKLANKKLDSDFLDRIARFVVEVPPIRHCKEDIRNDWEKVWKEVANFDTAPNLIWNKELYAFLSEHDLPGNFRDLQKIASYIIAYFIDTKNKSQAVNSAIQEYKKWRHKADSEMEKSYFQRNKTHNEIVAYFEQDLVNWATKEYGSIDEASKVLGRSKDMLRKYMKLNRLTK